MAVKESDNGSGVTSQTGYAFVSKDIGAYIVSEVDANKIFEVSSNLYINGPVTQTVNMVMSGDVSISVYDDKDDVVEDLSRKLNKMFSQPGCNITSCARASLKDMMVWAQGIYNQYWVREGNELVCKELSRLHPYSFRNPPMGSNLTRICGRILRGIYYDTEDRNVHYCQTQQTSTIPIEIDRKSMLIVKDPCGDYPDGESVIYSIVPIVDFLSYAWNTLGQQMYRTGAPIMFIKIENPQPEKVVNGEVQESDVAYAEKIIATSGKDTSYVLRQNMEIINFEVKEGSLAILSINKGNETIRDYLSPVGMLGRDGTLIGGNSDASLKLVNNNIDGWVRLLENSLRELPNYYLKYNGYPDSWHAEVTIPHVPMEDKSYNLQKAQLGYATKAFSVNEIRELLGSEGVGDDELVKMKEEWEMIASQMQQGQMMFNDVKTTPGRGSYKRRNEIAKEAENTIDEATYELERAILKSAQKAAREAQK